MSDQSIQLYNYINFKQFLRSIFNLWELSFENWTVMLAFDILLCYMIFMAINTQYYVTLAFLGQQNGPLKNVTFPFRLPLSLRGLLLECCHATATCSSSENISWTTGTHLSIILILCCIFLILKSSILNRCKLSLEEKPVFYSLCNSLSFFNRVIY